MNSPPGTTLATRSSRARPAPPGGLLGGPAGQRGTPAPDPGRTGEGQPPVRTLGVLGLSAGEEAVYAVVLGLSEATAGDAYGACPDLDPAEASAALESLACRGLVTRLPGVPRRYAPVAPETVLGSELMRREQELGRARAMVAALGERYRAVPRHTGAGELVEVITGRRQAARRWSETLVEAKDQVRVLARAPLADEAFCPGQAGPGLPGRGVTVRAVYEQAAVASGVLLARCRAEIDAGVQVRVTGQVPLQLWLADERLGLLPLCQERPDAGGLLAVYPSPLLDVLSALFDKSWADAIPLMLGASASPDGVGVPFGDSSTRAVFGLLAAGLTDQAIARRLGCSERTVQRHVRKITSTVGATSRFQAGLQIGRRHWIA